MIPAAAVLIALLCAAASARRLWFATNATYLHPDEVLSAIGDAGREGAVARLREAVKDEARAEWEHALLEALDAKDAAARTPLVNEQLRELDYRFKRWARVPRVCASIATSSGFLLATLVMRKGLAEADLSGETAEALVRGLVGDALTVAAFGLAGTAFCIAVMAQAKRVVKARTEAADRLVELLEGA